MHRYQIADPAPMASGRRRCVGAGAARFGEADTPFVNDHVDAVAAALGDHLDVEVEMLLPQRGHIASWEHELGVANIDIQRAAVASLSPAPHVDGGA